jgi:hypothetical protein
VLENEENDDVIKCKQAGCETGWVSDLLNEDIILFSNKVISSHDRNSINVYRHIGND